MKIFISAFIVCFISYALHTYWHFQVYKGVDFKQRGILFNVITHLIVFVGYFAFGFMIFSDPLQVKMHIVIRMIGFITALSGALIGLLATKEKKGYQELDYLVKTGIYSKLRNPMYFGLVLMHIGLPLAFGSMFTLLSAFIWIAQLFLWKHWEEQILEKKFGSAYIDYKKKTIL
jgi:protein-S-isoprenylcysteine O-methyltransferase Ste14